MKADVTGRGQSDRIGTGWGRKNSDLGRTESVLLIMPYCHYDIVF